jgi:hypothetical protein
LGLVKISEPMHDNVRIASGALNRSINAQAEHWLRIGMMCELHPELKYGELCRLLIQDEIQAEAQVLALPKRVRA